MRFWLLKVTLWTWTSQCFTCRFQRPYACEVSHSTDFTDMFSYSRASSWDIVVIFYLTKGLTLTSSCIALARRSAPGSTSSRRGRSARQRWRMQPRPTRCCTASSCATLRCVTLCAARRLEAAGFGAMDICAHLQDMCMSCGTAGHFACNPWYSMLEPACRSLGYVWYERVSALLGSGERHCFSYDLMHQAC